MRKLAALALILCAFLTLALSSRVIYQQITSLTIPFDTDESDHANAAIELYTALISGDGSAVAQSLFRQGFYPPLNSVATAASYLAFQPSYASSRLPSLYFFVVTALLLGLAVYRSARALAIDQTTAIISAAIGITLIATSDIATRNSALCMLEPLAMLLTTGVLLLLTYRDHSAASNILVGLELFLVTLTKYSFGILLVPGVALGLLIEPGKKSNGERVRNLLPSLATFSLMLACWLLLTDRSAAWHFLVGHPSNAPMLSAENLTYEIRAFIQEYCASTTMAVVSIVLATLGTIFYWRTSAIVRQSACITLCALGILLLSTTNEARHFMVAMPPMFLLASLGLVGLISRVQKTGIRVGVTALFGWLLIAPIPNFVTALPGSIRAELEGQPGFAALQDLIIHSHNPGEPMLVIGSGDNFSIEALRWLEAKSYGIPYTRTSIDAFPFDAKRDYRDMRRKRNRSIAYLSNIAESPLEQIVASGPYKTLVLIRTVGARNENFEWFKRALPLVAGKVIAKRTSDDKEVIIAKLSPPE